MIEAKTWVRVHNIELPPEERTGKLPEDTRKAPFELWVKGFLKTDAEIGDAVEIETLTGRTVRGELVEANPIYRHNFGDAYIPELLQIGIQARGILKEGTL